MKTGKKESFKEANFTKTKKKNYQNLSIRWFLVIYSNVGIKYLKNSLAENTFKYGLF